MTSLFWYICYAIIGLGVAAFTIYTKRHIFKISTLIIFCLFAASITWIGEFLVLGIFNSYAYKPGIFTDIWAENLLGHLLTNTTLWPGAAILVAAYSLGFGWCTLIIAFFIFSEYLFMQLGIYEQHWWNFYFTGIVIIVFIIISKKWFSIMNRIKYGLKRIVIFYFVAFLLVHLPAPLLLLFGKQYYSLDLMENIVGNIYRSSTIFIFSYHLIESIILVYFVCKLDKWFWKFVPFVLELISLYILAEMNILIFLDGWNLVYTYLLYSTSFIIFILLEKHCLKPSQFSMV